MTQNYALICLNVGIDETDEEFQNTLKQLRNVLNNVTIFTNSDECVDFLTDLEDTMTILVLEDTIGEQIMPLIHDVSQLDHVYGFSSIKSLSSKWINEWPKVKGIYMTSTLLCRAIELAIKQQDQDSIAVSLVSVNRNDCDQNLDQLEPSFMYTQIFKEILLETKYDEKSFHDFINFCHSNKCGSTVNIDLFTKEYHDNSAMLWYTRPTFIYSMLNDALRTLQVDIIIKIGFYISRLHQEIQQLHQKQFLTDDPKSFTVFRGQAMWEKDFEKLRETRGGLISFNNFLSTSEEKNVALVYAQSNSARPGKIGILFKMFIDPSVSSIPFANIKQASYFKEEKEVLFSMHTIFRIIHIEPIDDNGRLYLVDLQLTPDDDEELRILTNHIANQIGGDTGWDRLANFLLRINYLDKAEELYNTLLEQTSKNSDRVQYYNQLFNIKYDQHDSEAAASYVEKIVEIEKQTLPVNDPSLSTSHNNSGFICCTTGECARTLIFYNKSPEIDEKALPADHDSFTSNFHNIATADDTIRTSSDSSLYEKAVEMYERTLAPNEPCLSISSNNTAGIFEDLTGDSKALAFNEKLLEIRQKSLAPNHPDLAISYYMIAKMYHDRGEYSKALSFYQQCLEIFEKTLPASHPYLGIVCDHIAVAHCNMAEYSKALLFHEKALRIFQRVLPTSHPDLATAYHKIASLHYEIKEYPKALHFYEKALEIGQEILPPDSSDLATFYHNVASTHVGMGEDSKALSFYEKELEILRGTLPPSILVWQVPTAISLRCIIG